MWNVVKIVTEGTEYRMDRKSKGLFESSDRNQGKIEIVMNNRNNGSIGNIRLVGMGGININMDAMEENILKMPY